MSNFDRRGSRGGIPVEKPFTYLPLSNRVERNNYLPLDELVKKGYITGSLEVEFQVISDYLFVGSGDFELDNTKRLYYHTFKRTNNELCIPSSSLKGAIRTVSEAISNSCVSNLRRNEFRVLKNSKMHYPCRRINNLCPCCQIFGTTNYSGKVKFEDAKPLEEIDVEIVKIGELFSPRNRPPMRKFYQHKKFDPIHNLNPEKQHRFIEAVPNDTKFNTKMKFQNLAESELSLLLYSMGIAQDYFIKLGGAKPRCFGTVQFKLLKLKLINDEKVLNPEEMFEVKEQNYVDKVMQNRDLINNKLLENFTEEMKLNNNKCPKGNY